MIGDAFHIFHRKSHGHEHHRKGFRRTLRINIVVEEGNHVVCGSNNSGGFGGFGIFFGCGIGDSNIRGAGTFADGFVVFAAGGEKESGSKESYENFLEVHNE